MPRLKIPLREWLELEFLRNYARKFTDLAAHICASRQLEEYRAGNNEEHEVFVDLFKRFEDGEYPDVGVQAEWLGGDSSNPRNHSVREPNCVRMGHRFEREEVDKYRDDEGNLRLPSRLLGEVYVVTGHSGEGDEYCEWPVRAYLYGPDAIEHCDRLEAYVKANRLQWTMWSRVDNVMPEVDHTPEQREAWIDHELEIRSACRTNLDPQMHKNFVVRDKLEYTLVTVPLNVFGDVPQHEVQEEA